MDVIVCSHGMEVGRRDCMNLQLPVQSVPITTKVGSSHPTHGEVYSIQHCVIKFISGFLWVLRFPPPIKKN